MHEQDFLCLRVLRSEQSVPLAVGYRAPEVLVAQAVAFVSEVELVKACCFHRFHIQWELLTRTGETDELNDNAVVPYDPSEVAETAYQSVEVLLIVVLPPPVAESIKRCALAVLAVSDPKWGSGLPAAENLPAMVQNVNGGIRR
jgi:hypothetical protein